MFEYKNHIQGLRAFAVFFVIIYHLNQSLFQFGFLGVDIFFVISGYVITQSILKNFDKNKNLNIINFYIKRFKRLYPSLIFVTLFTFFLYLIFGTLENFNVIVKSFLSSLLSISNFYFLRIEYNYFNEIFNNPYLHTWSLGVEDQFYLIYPIILLFFLKTRILKYFLHFLFLISLIYFLLIDQFFNPLTRFWEMFLGCLTFLYLGSAKQITLGRIIKPLSYILFLISFYFAYYLYYQASILVVCAATTLSIVGSKDDKILNSKYIVFLGKISYSTYLIHLPVFYFGDLYLQNANIEFKILISISLIIFVYLLSYLNFKYIENYFRYNFKFNFKIFKIFLPISAVIILFTIINFDKKFYFLKYEAEKFNIISKNFLKIFSKNDFDNINYNYVTKNCHNTDLNSNIKKNCYLKKETNKIYGLIGDSHALHYYPSFKNIISNNSFFFTSIGTGAVFSKNLKSINQNHFNINNLSYADRGLKFYQKNLDLFIKLSKNYEKKYLIVSNRLDHYLNSGEYLILDESNNMLSKNKALDHLKKEIENFTIHLSKQNINVIFILNLPSPNISIHQCLIKTGLSISNYRLNNSLCNYTSKKSMIKRKNIVSMLKQIQMKQPQNFYILDPFKKICNIKNGEICSFNFKDNKNKYYPFIYDKSHLSISAAKLFEAYFTEELKKIE